MALSRPPPACSESLINRLAHLTPPHSTLTFHGPEQHRLRVPSPIACCPPDNPNAKPGQSYDDSIALIRDRATFLSDDEKEWILRKTAEKVFWGPAPDGTLDFSAAKL